MCLAVPGKILSIEGDNPLDIKGKVEFGGIAKEISLSYVPEAKVGEYVIVHAGFAINKIDEKAALETIEELRNIADSMDNPE